MRNKFIPLFCLLDRNLLFCTVELECKQSVQNVLEISMSKPL